MPCVLWEAHSIGEERHEPQRNSIQFLVTEEEVQRTVEIKIATSIYTPFFQPSSLLSLVPLPSPPSPRKLKLFLAQVGTWLPAACLGVEIVIAHEFQYTELQGMLWNRTQPNLVYRPLWREIIRIWNSETKTGTWKVDEFPSQSLQQPGSHGWTQGRIT